jgi:hypothetical protein
VCTTTPDYFISLFKDKRFGVADTVDYGLFLNSCLLVITPLTFSLGLYC